ncbi:hypothetical protein BG61_08715 [Caballeronia glathei]|uniref:Uncharacterized protein n=2 Tax=Caballeronia glathei TaxID=60547 RepID=A0A069PAN8_9BURK|nr:hypothetical protein BG61_08715 [Caballeronia glathei]
MRTFFPETVNHLSDRWTILMNQVDRGAPEDYPELPCLDVLQRVRQSERVLAPDPFEQDQIDTARHLAEGGDLKLALFKLHEVIDARMGG